MTFLEVDAIDVRYGLFGALRKVTIAANEGETVSIVGANGAGKTTLMRAISGAVPVASGTIKLGGEALENRPTHVINRLGVAMVPEGRRVFPSLTVDDNLLLGGYTHRLGHWTLERVYRLFPELVKRRHNKGLDLSGGEQQMVAIGRALMSNPRLLLLDEISLGLAPIVVNQMYEGLATIARQGTTILLVEQDVTRALKIASRVYCLLEGQVSLHANPADISQDQIKAAYFGV